MLAAEWLESHGIPGKANNVPDIDKEEDCGSKMGKSGNTLHFNGVHLLQWVVETVEVSLMLLNRGDSKMLKLPSSGREWA